MGTINIKNCLVKGLFVVLAVSVLSSVAQAVSTTKDLFLATSPSGLALPFPGETVPTSFIEFDDGEFLGGTAGFIVANTYYIDYVDAFGPAVPGEFIDQSFGDAIIHHNGAGGILSLDLTVAIGGGNVINVEIDPTSDVKDWFGYFEVTPSAEVPVPAAFWLFSSALGLLGLGRLRK